MGKVKFLSSHKLTSLSSPNDYRIEAERFIWVKKNRSTNFNNGDEIIRTKMIVTTIMIVIIVIGGCIFQNENSSNNGKLNEYFTAKEGKEIADQKAKDWKNDSILLQVWAHGDYEDKNGKSNTWEYDYYSPSSKEIDSDGKETYLQYAFNVHFNLSIGNC